MAIEDAWLLSAAERGNPRWRLPPWCPGNLVRPLVHGTTYFDRLCREVEALQAGDQVFFTDWRGDPDENLRDGGPEVAELFAAAARRGVLVKGLMWRSHTDRIAMSEEENRELGAEVSDAGGEVLLDQRIRRGGSHHQKLVVIRRPGRSEQDVAFVGGIDLCRGRRDSPEHDGDPQALPIAEAYGDRPPWHDVQLEVRGPAVAAFDEVFRERWHDPTSLDVEHPIAWLKDTLRRADLTPDPLPPRLPDPPVCGPQTVQVLRTYPSIRPRSSFAPRGERSVARGLTKALARATRLVYLEDQYMWSPHIAELLAAALGRSPDLHIVIVVPRHPDVDGRLALPPNRVGRVQAIQVCHRADPGRVHVFDVENHQGTPVYVHAKVAIVDDVWACVGSANLNRRSWSHDSELSCAVLDSTHDEREPRDPAGTGDGARTFPRDLRLQLSREHLDADDDTGLVDPTSFVAAMTSTAATLDAWHAAGGRGPRPPGRLRTHRPEHIGVLTRLWAVPAYRLVYDPDGRSIRDRLHSRW